LKEVIERVQKGENVDVEKLFGTGDEVKEAEWEDGMFHVMAMLGGEIGWGVGCLLTFLGCFSSTPD
jgi:hypothetical protein